MQDLQSERQAQQGDRDELVKKLNKVINAIRIGMFTTVDEDGSLRSRPMAAQSLEGDADLWFFTQEDAPKVDEVRHDQHVNVTFSDTGENRWISLTGRTEIIKDRALIEDLWKPFLKTWFPGGKEDPSLTILKVNVERAEYWDESTSPIALAFGFAKAAITGKRSQAGVGQKVQL